MVQSTRTLRQTGVRSIALYCLQPSMSLGARRCRRPVKEILQPGECTFFLKNLTTIFLLRRQNTGCQRRFTVKIKHIKRSDMVMFLCSVHTITEAKQYVGLGRAEPGLEPGRWIFQPGHLIWCALLQRRHCIRKLVVSFTIRPQLYRP